MPFHVRGKLRRNGSYNISGRIGGVPSDYGESTASDSLDPACIEGAVEAKKQYGTVYGSSSGINNGSATTATSSSTTSHIADKTMEFPRFRFEELTLGKVLGQGGFGKVYEIRSITCRESVTLTQLSQSDIGGYASSGGGGGCSNGGGGLNGHDSLCLEDLENNEDIDTSNESAEVHGFFSQLDEQNFKESRAFIAKHCLRQPSTNNINNDNSNHGGSSDGTKQLGSTGGSAKNLFSSSSNSGGGGGGGGGGKLGIKRKQQRDARYAIKFLKPEIIKNSNVYPSACYDMALETRVLSSIIHPNIIKLRAISSVPTFSKEYFFIMDRLYDTLEQRLEKWKRTMKRSNNVIGKLLFSDRTATKIETVTLDRMVSAYDLSSAIAYIHKQHIIYRDLKPENIGFDIRGDIKIFDFGLVAELRDEYRDPSGLYHLTPMTGSPRYMAPEVANKQHYNESCDTYSFSLVLWQMLALEVPFKDYDMQDFFKKVWQAPHDRPPINEDIFGTRLFELLRDCWNPDLRQRRSMAEVEETLREENVVCRGGNETGVPDHQRRRSTHVFQPLELVRLSNSSFRSSGNKSFASLGTTLGFHLSFSRQ